MTDVSVRARNEKAPATHAVAPRVQPQRGARLPLALLAPLAALATSATGCQVVEGIFKTGFWFGVIAVVAVVALLLFGVGKLFS
ncbi:MAG TPA: hypothetical protein VGK73_15420 [Polyangiaceae bacterium]